MACAAVVAIFMGGLGLGSYVLGKKIDTDKTPLRTYAKYELAVAVSAALSPFLVWCVEQLYYATGGSAVLGLGLSYVVRLVLATLVLGVPTFFMGGTLVAAVAAVQTKEDASRTQLGRLYGANTAGAVVGCLMTTFVTVEVFGVSRSLWLACLMNLLLAVYAFKSEREKPDAKKVEAPAKPCRTEISGETWPDMNVGEQTPVRRGLKTGSAYFLLFCSAWVGFAFFAMEMVWYRIFAPLLGGSSYSFGIVLSVALAGIAVGGAIFGRRRDQETTMVLFALSCALEALFLVLPFAFGDSMATLTLALRPLGIFGFWGVVASWGIVATFVVFLPALLAGFQFPVLVSLLGSGKEDIGQDVGRVYAFNTLGAILGAVSGGFGLLAWMGANTLWVALTISLVGLSMTGLGLARRSLGSDRVRGTASAVAAVFALCCTMADGPSAALRHSPIGAGRLRDDLRDRVRLENRYRSTRRNIVWEADGREVTVGVSGRDAFAFVVNGKVDGNVRSDAGTQVMCALLGAILHGAPKQGLVVGLGTGMSAGWLAQVPTMKQVDVVELEPAILKMAELSAQANHDVLEQDNVQIHITDGREFLQTTDAHYDVIMSEPSNPYRVGIASLFSQDFYRSVQSRLSEDGVFVQWLQIYEVDAQTVRTVIATLGSVFPSVEIWQTQGGDLSLVARNKDEAHRLDQLETLVSQHPYDSALEKVWGVQGVSGLFSGFVASSGLAAKIAKEDEAWVDTDDSPVVEFGFSRTVGKPSSVKLRSLRQAARASGADSPKVQGSFKELEAFEAQDVRSFYLGSAHGLFAPPSTDQSAQVRAKARTFARQNRHKDCLATWRTQSDMPKHPGDQIMLARAAALLGDDEVERYLSPVAQRNEVDGRLLRSFHQKAKGDFDGAARSLADAYRAAQQDFWFSRSTMQLLLGETVKILRSTKDSDLQRAVFDALGAPFAGRALDVLRKRTRLAIANTTQFKAFCGPALAPFEGPKRFPLELELMRARLKCYQDHGDERAEQARVEFMELLRDRAAPFFTEGAS